MGLIYGRLAGSDMYFRNYSVPILSSRQLWHGNSLKKFLSDPQSVVPGTLCGLKPIKDDAVAVDLIQFLKELTLANYSFIRSMVVIINVRKSSPQLAKITSSVGSAPRCTVDNRP